MAQKKRDEQEIEATRKALPLKPPEEIIEIIKKRQKAEKLVYRVGYVREPITGIKDKAVLVKCTKCGEKYYLDYMPSFNGCANPAGDKFGFLLDYETKVTTSKCHCLVCDTEAEALHIGHIRRGAEVIEKTYFMTMHNVRGHFAALSWILFKECDKDAKVYYTLRRYEAIVTVGGRPIRYTGYDKTMYYGISWKSEWCTRAVWKDNCDEWDASEIFAVDDIETTDAAKSAVDVFIREGQDELRIGAYMQLWTKYPQIENLTRNKLTPFVKKIIEEATHSSGYYYSEQRAFSIGEIRNYINVKKVKPAEILRLPKEDLHLANEWGVKKTALYATVLENQKIKLTEEQLKDAEQLGILTLRNLFEDGTVPVIRTLNYLKRQRKSSRHFINADYLRDYWNMTREIQNGIPEELKYPKDLKAAHDLAVIRRKEKTDKEMNEKIEAFAKTLDWLAYEDEETGLLIRAAQSQDELIKEGKILGHCVATYSEKVSRRETSIFFVRKMAEPEMPFFTLEFSKDHVVQNRGKKNCDRTPKVRKFEEKWLNHIKELQKGKKRNGKHTGSQTAASARA